MTWTLHEGDCLGVMRSLPSESIDALVTDPPYGIGMVYDGRKEAASSPDDYWEWFRPRYDEALRLVKPGGFVAVWQTQKYFRYFWDWYGEQIHIYVAAKNWIQIRPTPINYGYDPVVMFYKPGAKPLCPVKPQRGVDWFVANTSAAIFNTSRVEGQHPRPRPLDQVREILRNFALPGGTVLDPFAGAGTTLMAAHLEGMGAIGIEIHPPYCAAIGKRLALTPIEEQLLLGVGE